jgi:hypothetical protein
MHTTHHGEFQAEKTHWLMTNWQWTNELKWRSPRGSGTTIARR